MSLPQLNLPEYPQLNCISISQCISMCGTKKSGWLRNHAPVENGGLSLLDGFQPSFWCCRISLAHPHYLHISVSQFHRPWFPLIFPWSSPIIPSSVTSFYPKCSMYGILTFIGGHFGVSMEVNIPAPWSTSLYHFLGESMTISWHFIGNFIGT